LKKGRACVIRIKWLEGPDDLTDAYRVRFQVFVKEQNVPPELEIDDMDKIARHILVYMNSSPIGTGRLFVQNGKCYLGRIAVLREYRKQHIGTLIVKSLLQKAFNSGIDEVHIHAQIWVQDFYKKLGFIPYGKPFYEAGIEHISMVAYRPDSQDNSNSLLNETL
jgi:predicted GNAT family N-acyltransferase